MATLNRLQRLLEGRLGTLGQAAVLVLCVVVPTAMRWALQPVLGQTLWFSTYYPAVLCATLLLGWPGGLATLLLSAVAADYMFMPPSFALSLDKTDLMAVLVFLISGGLILLTAQLLRQALRRLADAAETQRALNRELQHRVNNNLAVVQALAAQTVRSNPEPAAFYEAFRSRLIALSTAQTVLSSGDWRSCDFPELPRLALQPFADSRVSMEGPDCSVPARACVPLVLALHELGTNAVKYGALSTPHGRVHLRWSLRDNGRDRQVVLHWSELGGPPVVPPTRRGLGSRLLVPQGDIRDVRVDYHVEGVRCTLVVDGATAPRGRGPDRAASIAPMGSRA